METLEFKTQTNSKVGRSFRVKKSSPTLKSKSKETLVDKDFDLAQYLKNSKGYVLGHAAFTK